MILSIDIVGLQQVQQDLRVKLSTLATGNAASAGLTQAANDVRSALVHEMSDVFDRPTPFTLGAVFVAAARGVERPFAEVGIKDNAAGVRPAAAWLRWQVFGGLRTHKAFERLLISGGFMRSDQRAVPGQAARLDAYGNISRGQLVQMLSQFRLEAGGGSNRAMPRVDESDNAATARAKRNSIRRALGRAGGRFVALPNGTRTLLPGVYLNEGRDFGAKLGFGSSRRLRPVLIFVSKAEYEPERFDFFDVAQRVARRQLPVRIGAAIAKAVAARAAR